MDTLPFWVSDTLYLVAFYRDALSNLGSNFPQLTSPSRGLPPQCFRALNPHIMLSLSVDTLILLSWAIIPMHRCPFYLAWTLTSMDSWNSVPRCLPMWILLSTFSSYLALGWELPGPSTSCQYPFSAHSNGFMTRLFGKERAYFLLFYSFE